MAFLEINGISLEVTEDAAVQAMQTVAAKELDVAGIATFFKKVPVNRCIPAPSHVSKARAFDSEGR